MKISQKTFRDLLTSEQISFWTATSIVGRSYCGPMTANGLCTTNCTLCKQKLQETLELSNAKNPSALLTWKLRNLVAEMQEQRQQEEHKPVNEHPLGFQTNTNPFEALLRETE